MKTLSIWSIVALALGCAPSDDSNRDAPAISVGRKALSASSPGGSNYNWYTISACNREPYGIVANYGVSNVRSTVQGQLAAMRQSGQARLRIGLYHGRGLNTGTVMNSIGGNLPSSQRANLSNFLADIRSAGFAEIEFVFMPQGQNIPWKWPAWNEDLYQENWNLIYNLHPIVAASGLLYRIDLMNEGTPASSQVMLLKYAQRLWSDYTYTFGKNDTLGFSIIGDSTDRISQIPQIYRGNTPYLYDFHFYGASQTEQQQFIAARQKMQSLGLGQVGWIVGEAFFNDPTAANGIQRAITSTGQTVFYVAEWPLHRGASCSDVDVAPPVAFDAYRAYGF